MTDEKTPEENPQTDSETSSNQADPTAEVGQEPFDAVAAVAEMEAAMAQAEATTPGSGGSDRYIETLEKDILELNQLVEAKDAQLTRAASRVERAYEEIEKTKARLEADAERQVERRTRKVLVSFVEVLDELERALAGVTEANQPELVTGVEQVQRQFLTTLKGHGVQQVEALGEPFDPNVHEAVTTTPTTDAAQDGKVVAVMRAGYAIGEELLRPALVVVGKLTG